MTHLGETETQRVRTVSYIAEKPTRTVSPAKELAYVGVLARLEKLVAPYLWFEYPGKTKLFVAWTNSVAAVTLRSWCNGHRTPNPTVLRQWADKLDAEAATRQQLARDLRTAADQLDDRPKARRGVALTPRRAVKSTIEAPL